ncbi:MAG: DUF6161 domain-containing protein [Flavobacterium nitrogenifigens]|uniref:DUF6161 domain-containing protein n=1 Tax=Flavobacterium nitrogenifigens TaxID=1617283 RepID=UPI002806E017|nr:DUF6161 domain-containing protein [Flavobacterium nitrogenifigens]MDQ8015249.1 DUF6161 domain-containing protein [Flavobacterium nitrogenifigens]
MNTQEINKFLKSDASSEIRDSKFTLRFPIANFENTYGIASLHKYVTDQIKKWGEYDLLPSELLKNRNYFVAIQTRIEQLIESLQAGNSSYPLIGELQSAINTYQYEKMLPADSSEASFLISLFKESAQLFDAAYAYFTQTTSYSSFSNKEYLKGTVMAVLYEIQESPSISRSSHERSSFNSLKNKVEKYVSDSDKDLSNLLKESQDKVDSFVEELDNLKKDNQEKLDKWFSLNQATARDLSKDVNDERKNIEQTYKELLQLQAPAQHWKETAQKLLDEGHMFMRVLFALILVGGFSLYMLLWKTPESMLASFFSDDKTAAIRWSIVFVTFISLIFFGIQSLRKAMFSSFHLARDAQEREKLTMYYLSLIKEGAIIDDDKKLILQSLFSRADSGLLKEDSSPTMPGIIDKIKG